MKRLFIVNPHAGRGKALRIWHQIERELTRRGIKSDCFLTKGPGEAAVYAGQHAGNYDQLICIGGDGTLNEVVNGIYGQSVKLGIIPAGTGNDFARLFKWSENAGEQVDRLERCQTAAVDLIKMKDRVFINVAGMGFDAAVAEHANASKILKRLGPVGYIASVLQKLPTFRPSSVQIELDGNKYTFDDTLLLAVGNAQSYGGGMRIIPDADYQDGLLDVCVVSGITKLQLLRVFPKVFSGKHTTLDPVTILRGKRLQVKTNERFSIHADGEILQRNRNHEQIETFEIIPRCIQLII